MLAQLALPETEKVLSKPAELLSASSLRPNNQHQLGWRVPDALSP